MKSTSISPGADSYAEQATGCRGVNGYKEYARSLGYKRIEVLNWCSSAGDWQFLVSTNGEIWQVLDQTNNSPRPGFSYAISDECFEGTWEEAAEYFSMG